MSQVHWTSLAVKDLPSCQVTPCRKRSVSSVASSFHDQPVAKSGTNRLQAVLWHMLIVHDKIVEDAHHWPFGEDRRFLVDRHACRAVGRIHFQDVAGLLRDR